MKRSILAALMSASMLGMNSYATPSPSRTIRMRSRKRIKCGVAGSKLIRQAEDGVLTLRHRGGIVSQTFREMQMRNYQQGAKHGTTI